MRYTMRTRQAPPACLGAPLGNLAVHSATVVLAITIAQASELASGRRLSAVVCLHHHDRNLDASFDLGFRP